MIHTYKIYQLDIEGFKSRNKLFVDWKTLLSLGGFNLEDYEKVYEGEIDEESIDVNWVLERLFSIFNINHPKGFEGHSLSVSDVVDLDGELWYCDSYCWHKIQ